MVYCSSCGTANSVQATQCSVCKKPLQNPGSQSHVLLYCLMTSILLLIIVVVLDKFKALPSYISPITSGIEGVIASISVGLTILNFFEKFFSISVPVVNISRTIWASVATVCLITALFFCNPLLQFGTSLATAGAHADARATATIVSTNPYPSYLPGKGKLALYDPLKDNSSGNNWEDYDQCVPSGITLE